MSNEFDLGGHSLKEWSFMILMVCLVVVVVTFAASFVLAVLSDKATIAVTGDIDVGQFTAVILGIAMIATMLVSQQLTSKNTAAIATALAKKS